MWESQVNGCQLAEWTRVKAQENPSEVKPFATIGLSYTYKSSSKSTNSNRSVRPKTANVIAASARQIPGACQRRDPPLARKLVSAGDCWPVISKNPARKAHGGKPQRKLDQLKMIPVLRGWGIWGISRAVRFGTRKPRWRCHPAIAGIARPTASRGLGW